MKVSLEIDYHHIIKSESIDALIRSQMLHLEKFCDDISSCAVVVERPHTSEKSGSPFRVRLDLHVRPGHEIVEVAGLDENEKHDELQTVVMDAFAKAERQLKALAQRQHGKVKSHLVSIE